MSLKKYVVLLTICATLFSIQPTIADSNQKNLVVSYKKSTPNFPSKVSNYKLTMKSSPDSVRIFKGDDWVVPIPQFDPNSNGGASMSCDPYFWILRWRSNNPNVLIRITKGMTDFGFEPIEKVVTGGAGYASDYSCKVPAIKFGKVLGKDKSNLVDVNFEYEIWTKRIKI